MTSVTESCKRKTPLHEHDFQLVTTDLISSFGGDQEEDNGNNEDQKENRDSWVCGRCTLENPGPSAACLACGGKRSSTWSCSKCTLKNPAELSKCKVCEFPRKSVQKQKVPASGGGASGATATSKGVHSSRKNHRKCPRCTYENSAKSPRCEMCNTKLATDSCSAVSATAAATKKDVLNNNSVKHKSAVTVKPVATSAPSAAAAKQKKLPPSEQAAAAAAAAAAPPRPGSATSLGSRQESELMDQLREVEESEARDKWKHIVHFCKKVSISFLSLCIWAKNNPHTTKTKSIKLSASGCNNCSFYSFWAEHTGSN